MKEVKVMSLEERYKPQWQECEKYLDYLKETFGKEKSFHVFPEYNPHKAGGEITREMVNRWKAESAVP